MVSLSKSAGHGATSGSAASPGHPAASLKAASPVVVQMPRVPKDRGLVTRADDGLSFVQRTRDRRGNVVACDFFAVPDESYGPGWITGTKVAGELLVALQRDAACVPTMEILMAAAAIRKQRSVPIAEFSKVGAATAFLRTVGEALEFFSVHVDHVQYVADSVAFLSEGVRRRAAEEAARRAAFVDRMRAARQAKREARHG